MALPSSEEIPRCPYCLADLEPEEDRVRCEGCSTPHHAECFGENAGCSAYGCRVRLSVPSGQSIYLRKQITIQGGASVEQYDLGPFLVNVRTLPRQRERRRGVRPGAYARVSLEDSELRAGGVLKGQVVLYVAEDTRYKRLDLELLQGIGAPRSFARVALPLQEEEPHLLVAGSYPFEIELVAPDYVPPVDPFQLRLALVKSVFVRELNSESRVVFLLKRKLTLPSHLGGLANVPDGNAVLLSPERRQRIRVTGPFARSAEPDPFARSAEPDPFARSAEPDPFARSAEPDPFARSSDPVDSVPPDPFASVAPGASDPFLNDPFREVAWTPLCAGNPPGSRSLQGRLFAQADPPNDRVEIAAPRRPMSTEFALQVSGGADLRRLALGVHVEVVRPGGGAVEAEGFPDAEEVILVGREGFPVSDYEREGGLDLIYVVPPSLLERLSAVRQNGAHNAALRLRFAVDALTRGGQRLPCTSRSVTLTATS